MTAQRLLTLAALVICISGCGQTPSAIAAGDPAFDARMRQYLLEHPEVIEEAMAKLEERKLAAAEKVLAACGGRLDGAVMAAGLGPLPGRGRSKLITQVNYFGVVELLEAWRPALAATGSARVVVFSSNSTSTTPGLGRGAVKALLVLGPWLAIPSTALAAFAASIAARRPLRNSFDNGATVAVALCRLQTDVSEHADLSAVRVQPGNSGSGPWMSASLARPSRRSGHRAGSPSVLV